MININTKGKCENNAGDIKSRKFLLILSELTSVNLGLDREAWWLIVHRVTKSQTYLKWLRTHHNTCMYRPFKFLTDMSAQMFCQIFNWDFCLSYQVVSVLYTLSICLYQMLLLFSHSVMTNSLGPHRLQQARLPCPSLSPGVCSNSCPLSWLWPLWLALELSLCLWICHLACWCVTMSICVWANSLQLCPTLCGPMDCSLPGSSVHGILQARAQ